MFTGIVREQGRLAGDPRPSGQGGVVLVVEHSPELAAMLTIGASLAFNGVCLTVTEIVPGEPSRSTVELSPETIARTTLGAFHGGDRVNLEPALRAGDALGGHMVQGHVDGTTAVVGRTDLGAHRVLAFALPPELAPYLVEKGSVTVDGVSLTISALTADRFEVALIPHTLEVTTLSGRQVGDRVNLEVDVLSKYVHRILAARGLAPELPPGVAAEEPWRPPSPAP